MPISLTLPRYDRYIIPGPTMSLRYLTALLGSLVSTQVYAQQNPLYLPTAEPAGVNFTRLFTNEIIFRDTWKKDSWNGLTTFAKAPPLRCFGTEAEVPFDVAVLGMLSI